MLTISPRNLRAWLVTGAGAASYVGLCSYIGKRQLLPPILSRKTMHIGTGALYMLCWPLYDASPISRFLCASVPLIAALNFAAVGNGLLPDYLKITAGATRTGRKAELVKGPLFYGIMHSLLTVLYWKQPAAVIPLSILCGGDGFAEVIGRSIASPRLPYNKDKTVAGSIACCVAGAATAAIMCRYFIINQAFTTTYSLASMMPGIVIASVIGAVVESLPLPVNDVDNITIPALLVPVCRQLFTS